MTPEQYIDALIAAGIEGGLPTKEMDRRAAELLRVDVRTARRYRRGEVSIPGPARVALELLAKRRRRSAP